MGILIMLRISLKDIFGNILEILWNFWEILWNFPKYPLKLAFAYMFQDLEPRFEPFTWIDCVFLGRNQRPSVKISDYLVRITNINLAKSITAFVRSEPIMVTIGDQLQQPDQSYICSCWTSYVAAQADFFWSIYNFKVMHTKAHDYFNQKWLHYVLYNVHSNDVM